MSVGTMLKDVLTSLVRPPVTEKYPFERRPVPARLRGMVTWDAEKCTGCELCTRDCPAQALQLFVFDRKARRYVMHYQVDQCLFCAQCVQSCPQGALSMSNERWELAALCKDPFDVNYGDDEDVKAVLADRTEPDDQGK
jgi:formate hydrogenlyase subunit 6/NADH:ubiquinone oxidoreductase subunit I